MRALIPVNGGRRKVDVVARNGEHARRLVDVAGRGGHARVVPASRPQPAAAAAPAPPPRPPSRAAEPPRAAAGWRAATVVATARRHAATSWLSRRSRATAAVLFPWKSWTLTGLLAGGAAATGAVAWTSKRELDAQRARFPADYVEIDYRMRRTRGFALATDGLLIGTAIMTAISLYLTFQRPVVRSSLRFAVAVAADGRARRAIGGGRAGCSWCTPVATFS